MLLFINNKKEHKMLRQLLLISMLLATFSVADTLNEPTFNYKEENRVLKLELEILKLKEKNRELQAVIDNLQIDTKEDIERSRAITQLKKDLRMSRKIQRETPILLIR